MTQHFFTRSSPSWSLPRVYRLKVPTLERRRRLPLTLALLALLISGVSLYHIKYQTRALEKRLPRHTKPSMF